MLAARIFSRLVDPASSSPSKANLILDFIRRPAARMASSGNEHRDDGSLVVPCRARIKPPLRIEWRAGRRKRDLPAHPFRAMHCATWAGTAEWPILSDRAAGHRNARRTRWCAVAPGVLISPNTTGIRPRNRHQPGRDAALLHHLLDQLRVTLDICAVRCDIGDGKERHKLVDNRALMLLPPMSGLDGRRIGLRRGRQ